MIDCCTVQPGLTMAQNGSGVEQAAIQIFHCRSGQHFQISVALRTLNVPSSGSNVEHRDIADAVR